MRIAAAAFIPLSSIANERQIEIISEMSGWTFGTNAHSLVGIDTFAATIDNLSMQFEALRGLFRICEQIPEDSFIDLET